MMRRESSRINARDGLRLRGPNGAKDEFLLATAQKLRKLATLIQMPQPALA